MSEQKKVTVNEEAVVAEAAVVEKPLVAKKESKKKKVSVIGKTIKLDPRQGGMFVVSDVSLDGKSALVLTTFENGRDRFIVEADMSHKMIERGVRAGILRVLDKEDKDISVIFGGPLRYDPFKPLVTTAPQPVNPEVDKNLIDILNTNNFKSIRDRLILIKDRPTLCRLLELEKKGENPSAGARGYVIETIENIKKSLPGIDSTVSETEEPSITIK